MRLSSPIASAQFKTVALSTNTRTHPSGPSDMWVGRCPERGGGGPQPRKRDMEALQNLLCGKQKHPRYHPRRKNCKRKYSNSPDLGFCLSDYESESEKTSLGIAFFAVVAHGCGLCVPNMFITKANARKSGGNSWPCYYESESEKKSLPRFSFAVISVWMVDDGPESTILGCQETVRSAPSFLAS